MKFSTAMFVSAKSANRLPAIGIITISPIIAMVDSDKVATINMFFSLLDCMLISSPQ
ncbi:MAG: hypothetical protein LBN21_03210 [Treponema sp.]|nr:hypothetical protein [Treponema sp.]